MRLCMLAAERVRPCVGVPSPSQGLLGLGSSRWTAVGVLGLLLAGVGCGSLDENECFGALLRQVRDAHRDELMHGAGFAF